MLPYDAHVQAFQDDRTERASLDRINRAKEHWQASIQGSAESELMRNKLVIKQARPAEQVTGGGSGAAFLQGQACCLR